MKRKQYKLKLSLFAFKLLTLPAAPDSHEIEKKNLLG